MRGERNGRWRGGKVQFYGRDWKRIKEIVRARDRECRTCGKSAAANGRALDVHHLIPFRFSGDNSLENLVALCRSCHMRADDHGRRGSSKWLAANERTRSPSKRELRRVEQRARAMHARERRRLNQRRAREMRTAGSSLREIARELDVSHETVHQWLQGKFEVGEATLTLGT
jgi:5-methylcytosine-specific restriction endonuclease McrA